MILFKDLRATIKTEDDVIHSFIISEELLLEKIIEIIEPEVFGTSFKIIRVELNNYDLKDNTVTSTELYSKQ